MTHFHYIFVFYTLKAESGEFIDPVTIDIIGKNLDEAVKKARGIADHKAIDKRYFVVTSVIEHDHDQGVKEN